MPTFNSKSRAPGPVTRFKYSTILGVPGADGAPGANAAGGGTAYGPYASRPAANAGVTLYIPNDGPLPFISDGSVWVPYLGADQFQNLLQAPPASEWTEVQAGRSTLVDSAGTLLFTVAAATPSNDVWVHSGALPGTYTIDVAFSNLWAWDGTGGHEPLWALALYESSTGHFYRVGMYYGSGGFYMQVQAYTAPDTNSGGSIGSVVLNTGIMHTAGPTRFRVTFDGTNFHLFTTADGGTFGLAQVTWDHSFCTPNRLGIFVSATSNSVVPSRLLGLKIS
jgi:hypothetical protein